MSATGRISLFLILLGLLLAGVLGWFLLVAGADQGGARPFGDIPGRAEPPRPSRIGEDAGGTRHAASTSRSGFFRRPGGEELDFRLDCTNRTRVRDKQNHIDLFLHYIMKGVLRLQVVSWREDEVILHLACPDLDIALRANGTDGDPRAVRALEKDLRAGAHILMDATGRVLGIRFSPDVESGSRIWLRKLASVVQFSVPDPEKETWRQEEKDATGTWLAAYRWLARDRKSVG